MVTDESYSWPANPSIFLLDLEFRVSGRVETEFELVLPTTLTGATPGSGCLNSSGKSLNISSIFDLEVSFDDFCSSTTSSKSNGISFSVSSIFGIYFVPALSSSVDSTFFCFVILLTNTIVPIITNIAIINIKKIFPVLSCLALFSSGTPKSSSSSS